MPKLNRFRTQNYTIINDIFEISTFISQVFIRINPIFLLFSLAVNSLKLDNYYKRILLPGLYPIKIFELFVNKFIKKY